MSETVPTAAYSTPSARTMVAVGDTRTLDLVVQDVRDLVGSGVAIDAGLIAAAVRGWSANTRRAFRSDLTLWGQWCRTARVHAVDASGETVAG